MKLIYILSIQIITFFVIVVLWNFWGVVYLINSLKLSERNNTLNGCECMQGDFFTREWTSYSGVLHGLFREGLGKSWPLQSTCIYHWFIRQTFSPEEANQKRRSQPKETKSTKRDETQRNTAVQEDCLTNRDSMMALVSCFQMWWCRVNPKSSLGSPGSKVSVTSYLQTDSTSFKCSVCSLSLSSF